MLTPKEFRWLASNVAGWVEKILVKPSAIVQKGQILVELSSPELHQLAEEAYWKVECR